MLSLFSQSPFTLLYILHQATLGSLAHRDMCRRRSEAKIRYKFALQHDDAPLLRGAVSDPGGVTRLRRRRTAFSGGVKRPALRVSVDCAVSAPALTTTSSVTHLHL